MREDKGNVKQLKRKLKAKGKTNERGKLVNK